MGYMFDKELHVGDSDVAADFCYSLGHKIVVELKKQEKVKENFCNTDGILNVAMILADCFSNKEWRINPVTDYAKEFIPRFEKYIEKMDDIWMCGEEGEKNKKKHLTAYRKILSNLKNMVKTS